MLRFLAVTAIIFSCISARAEVVHDVEYYILKLQNRDKWAKEDQQLDRRLQLHLCRARAGHHCKSGGTNGSQFAQAMLQPLGSLRPK